MLTGIITVGTIFPLVNLMDRAYCISLQREVEINEVIELYRRGVISEKSDFACLDPKCRASYICINLGKRTYKVKPHFKTAIYPLRNHVEGCAYEVEDKNPLVMETGKAKKPRLPIGDDAEIIFLNSRPKNYFVMPSSNYGGKIDVARKLRYLSGGPSEPNSVSANPKCYSVEGLLNGGWKSKQKIVLDGCSGTIKSIIVPIDNNKPDEYRRFVYCGLAMCVPSDDEFFTFKFGRSFFVGSRMVDVYLKLANSAISASLESKSPYYRELVERIMKAAKNIDRYPNNPFFLYALGLPRLDGESGAFVIKVDNLDCFYIETSCNRSLLISPVYSDWEKNMHYFGVE